MIIKERLSQYPALFAFLNATTKVDIKSLGDMLDFNSTYFVQQRYPYENTVFDLARITAACGTCLHMDYVLKYLSKQKLASDLMGVLLRLAIRNLNNDVFYFLFTTYQIKALCSDILNQLETVKIPFSQENQFTLLLDAAAVSNNIEILDILLRPDDTGFAALGIQGSHAPKFTPLYYAAITNSLEAFRRLLACPKVSEQFPALYEQFCYCLDLPLNKELQAELNKLKPPVLSVATAIINRESSSSPFFFLGRMAIRPPNKASEHAFVPSNSLYISSVQLTPYSGSPYPLQGVSTHHSQDNEAEYEQAAADALTF